MQYLIFLVKFQGVLKKILHFLYGTEKFSDLVKFSRLSSYEILCFSNKLSIFLIKL